MQLPNRDEAYIPRAKLTEYLLSETHEDGKTKAAFFKALGFEQSNADSLRQLLLEIARAGEVQSTRRSRYGVLYVIEAMIIGLTGRAAWVRTVWMIPTGESRPRLVTAYPAGRRGREVS